MPEVITVDFQSRVEQSDNGTELRTCLCNFLTAQTLETAQNLCDKIFPTSEFYSSQCLVDGRWIATVRFDNLLHDGEGPTEAAALLDALARIFDILHLHTT